MCFMSSPKTETPPPPPKAPEVLEQEAPALAGDKESSLNKKSAGTSKYKIAKINATKGNSGAGVNL